MTRRRNIVDVLSRVLLQSDEKERVEAVYIFPSAPQVWDRRRPGQSLPYALNLAGEVSPRLLHPLLPASARRMSSFDGRFGSITLRAVSTPATGSPAGSRSPSWTNTEA